MGKHKNKLTTSLQSVNMDTELNLWLLFVRHRHLLHTAFRQADIRGSTGFDRGFEVGEAIRRRDVTSQT